MRPATALATRPRRSYRLGASLFVSATLTFGTLAALRALDVPLGEADHFVYRYSPWLAARLLRTWPVWVALGVGAILARFPPQRAGARRVAGPIAGALLLLGAAAWVWWAPPAPVAQHALNLRSPSHEGAFVMEAERIDSLADYLREFDRRIQKSPADLRGTRVLSNPPGMTILATWLRRAFGATPERPGAWGRYLIEREHVEWAQTPLLVDALNLSIALIALWAASGAFAYLLGRLFLSPAGALLFALLATFNPCTVHFSPGKDAAQLLTINAMLWAWFGSARRGRAVLAGLSGAWLMIGASLGLVHLWVAAVALAATVWHGVRSRRAALDLLVRRIVPAALGAASVSAVAYAGFGWNLPATLMAVGRRFGEVQEIIRGDRALWFAIGLPTFLLFVAPGFWALLALGVRRRGGLGRRLLYCTLGALLATYLMGMTYELPRLWIAFLPTLMLGVAIDPPLLRGRARGAALRAIMAIGMTQVAFTSLHWTLLDVRESEYRLVTQRYFW